MNGGIKSASGPTQVNYRCILPDLKSVVNYAGNIFTSAKMNGVVLGVLALVALPCALGIQCYSCKVSGPTSLCDKDLSNTTDLKTCSSPLDACVTTALTIKSKVGSLEKAAYTMTCGQKSICSKIETDNCGPDGLRKHLDKVPGFEVTKCGVACCQTPMCNKRDIVQPKPITKNLGTNTSASFLVSGIMFVLGFILF